MNFNMGAHHRRQKARYEARRDKYLPRIRELLAEGKSGLAIARDVGTPPKFIYKVLRELELNNNEDKT